MKKNMYKKTHLSKKAVIAIGAFTTGIVGIGILQLSGIENPFAPSSIPAAGAKQPYTTASFTDAFKADTINTEKWQSFANGSTVSQTTTNLLKIAVQAGSNNNKAKNGGLVFKPVIGADKDFVIVTEVYEPKVTGEGLGVAGVRFAASKDVDNESSSLFWQKGAGVNKLVLLVKDPNENPTASVRERASVAVPNNTNRLALRLARIGNKYTAQYKVGGNNPDVAWQIIGAEDNPGLGSEGQVRLYASNLNSGNKTPEVMVRFDTTIVRWDDGSKPEANVKRFVDNFADGSINTEKWMSRVSSGAYARETKYNNLNLGVASGLASKRPAVHRTAKLVLNEDIAESKDFTARVQIYKPKVVGKGLGKTSLGFASNGKDNDETASITWAVDSSNTSTLVFAVNGADGKPAEEKQRVAYANDKVTLIMKRIGNTYTVSYIPGINDPDKDGETLGSITNNSAAKGKIALWTSNNNLGDLAPKVVTRIDQFSLMWK